MFAPRQTKFPKSFKGKLRNNSIKTHSLEDLYNGPIRLISKEAGRLKSLHLNCLNMAIRKSLKKNLAIHHTSFPHTPVTSKPLEVRMGKGKGSFDHWTANVFSGTTLIKITALNSKTTSISASLKVLNKKMPLNIRVISPR